MTRTGLPPAVREHTRLELRVPDSGGSQCAPVGTRPGTAAASHVSGKITNPSARDTGERDLPRDKKRSRVLTWDRAHRHKASRPGRTEHADTKQAEGRRRDSRGGGGFIDTAEELHTHTGRLVNLTG